MTQQFFLYLANNFTKKFTGCVGLSVFLVVFAVIALWNRIKRKQTAAGKLKSSCGSIKVVLPDLTRKISTK